MTDTSSLSAFSTRTVGDIAATLPGATAVFRRHKLDFCCGGDVPLRKAAAERGADIEAIEAALAALDRDGAAPAATDTASLIAHIVARYHQTHRRELPELIRLARRVEAVHRGHPRVPTGLADTLETISGEIEEHMLKEEGMLFPLMLQGGHPMLMHPIAQMRHDHDAHGEALGRVDRITGGFRLPDDACRSWQALNTGTAKLAADLMEHIHLENNVLFPAFEAGAAPSSQGCGPSGCACSGGGTLQA